MLNFPQVVSDEPNGAGNTTGYPEGSGHNQKKEPRLPGHLPRAVFKPQSQQPGCQGQGAAVSQGPAQEVHRQGLEQGELHQLPQQPQGGRLPGTSRPRG